MKVQQGMTLIGLLISINLSMLAILATLSLYLNHQIATDEAKQGTEFNTQLMQSRLVIENELMSAGYGIEADVNAKITINNVPDDHVDLLWKYDDGGMVCRGLRETGTETRLLTLMEATAATCVPTGDLTTMSWNNVNVLGRWPVRDALASYLALADNDSLFQFTLNAAGSCSPFTRTLSSTHQSITISSPSIAELNIQQHNTSALPANEISLPVSSDFSVCLPNI